MFAEIEKIMDHSLDGDNFIESLSQNVTGKKSNSGVEKTANYLKQLYGFDNNYAPFQAFKYFWAKAETIEKPLLAFIYAINHDDLLAESIQVVAGQELGTKTAVETFEEVLEKYHPLRFSANTRRSMAQNIASSWKQAGFIEGRMKNIRVKPFINYRVACFAFLLAYLNGDRADFIWNSTGVKALCLYESNLRELAIECQKRDLLQYQFAGGVTIISFKELLNRIGINES